MVALGISHASATRVGNLVGAGERQEARRAAWVAVGMAAGAMALFAVAFILFRWQLPALFLPAGATAAVGLAAAILPIASAFQVFDGTQAVGGGVLRGLGDTQPAAWFNFVGYYVLGLPLAVYLAFRGEAWGLPGLGWGLPGIWIGLALGLGAVAALLVLYIARHGPGAARSRSATPPSA
jgi:MATE family multidrug resistance protein